MRLPMAISAISFEGIDRRYKAEYTKEGVIRPVTSVFGHASARYQLLYHSCNNSCASPFTLCWKVIPLYLIHCQGFFLFVLLPILFDLLVEFALEFCKRERER
ncbi:unnamed protein product, partial [Musa hybrid cultivar]